MIERMILPRSARCLRPRVNPKSPIAHTATLANPARVTRAIAQPAPLAESVAQPAAVAQPTPVAHPNCFTPLP